MACFGMLSFEHVLLEISVPLMTCRRPTQDCLSYPCGRMGMGALAPSLTIQAVNIHCREGSGDLCLSLNIFFFDFLRQNFSVALAVLEPTL